MDEDRMVEELAKENDLAGGVGVAGKSFFWTQSEKHGRTQDDGLASSRSTSRSYGRCDLVKRRIKDKCRKRWLNMNMGWKHGRLCPTEPSTLTSESTSVRRDQEIDMNLKDLKANDQVPWSPTTQTSNEPPGSKLCSMFGRKRRLTARELLAMQQNLPLEETAGKAFYMWGREVWPWTILERLIDEEGHVPLSDFLWYIKACTRDIGLIVQNTGERLADRRKTLVKLPTEKKKLQRKAFCQRQQLGNMNIFSSVFKQIDEQSSLGTLTLDFLVGSFLNLQRLCANEYKLYNLSSIACSYAVPLFIKNFESWAPLQNPNHGREEISAWKTLLVGEDSLNSSDMDSPYSQLVMACVYPAVKISGTNTWKATDSQRMLFFLESWKNLLPPLVVSKILDTVVMPKISLAVDSWNPHMQTIDDIRSWILPWQSLLGDQLEACLNTISARLGGDMLHI